MKTGMLTTARANMKLTKTTILQTALDDEMPSLHSPCNRKKSPLFPAIIMAKIQTRNQTMQEIESTLFILKPLLKE